MTLKRRAHLGFWAEHTRLCELDLEECAEVPPAMIGELTRQLLAVPAAELCPLCCATYWNAFEGALEVAA